MTTSLDLYTYRVCLADQNATIVNGVYSAFVEAGALWFKDNDGTLIAGFTAGQWLSFQRVQFDSSNRLEVAG